eukprot:SM005498S18180  [mRNA]  locus=s5498:167:950:- [translate_table: standard]
MPRLRSTSCLTSGRVRRRRHLASRATAAAADDGGGGGGGASNGASSTAGGLAIDLRGKTAFVAGVADDQGFGWAISKALAEAGARVLVGTWVPALSIFETSLRRGKFDESRKYVLSIPSQLQPPYQTHGGACILSVCLPAIPLRTFISLPSHVLT